MLAPIVLPANQPPARFYAGGDRIAEFRGAGTAEPFTPEDWIASTTSVRGEAPAGLTVLPDGEPLGDAVERDPAGWLGEEHAARWGADTRLLVKLLDAGQRLPVHAHPDDAFAARTLGSAHGKAEAWYILRGGTVHLGLRRDVDPDELGRLVDGQHVEELLGLLHRIEVAPNDSVYVPAGTLHAIGEGVLLAEVQQPEDLSILTEWSGFAIDGAAAGNLGLGFETALGAVTTTALDEDGRDALVRRGVEHGSALAPAADAHFRLDRVRGGDVHAAGFAVLIGETGELELSTDETATLVGAGTTVVVPAAAGDLRFHGDGTVLLARPPHPSTPEG